jgi:U3 small nucleolar ribonucleoprotein protein IMP3
MLLLPLLPWFAAVVQAMEDFITWTDGSKIKKTVMDYNDQLDDFDLLRE